MSIEGQGHFFTIYFPGFVCFVLYKAKISGERLQDHWSSGFQCTTMAESQEFLWFLVSFYFINVTLYSYMCLKLNHSRFEGEVFTKCQMASKHFLTTKHPSDD